MPRFSTNKTSVERKGKTKSKLNSSNANFADKIKVGEETMNYNRIFEAVLRALFLSNGVQHDTN